MSESQRRSLSIYVHIPFCKAKCNYCDFLSFGGSSYTNQKAYVSALIQEIKLYRQFAKEYRIDSIFFGGGTPSYVEESFIQTIMETIRNTFLISEDAEITIEGNPDSLTLEKLRVYKEAGINRLSIGLQSANDAMLNVLGRVHNYDQFVAAYSNARQAGFHNINVDIMSGLPGESTESYVHTLAKVVRMQPEHISAYSLIVEEGTLLSKDTELLELMPSEEMDRQLYSKTKMFLKNSGYDRYEISNYAKKGFECRHNQVYWNGGEYLGVGLGASSYLAVLVEDGVYEKIRFHGVENPDEYIGRFSNCFDMKEDAYTDMYHYYTDDLLSDSDSKYNQYENHVVLQFIRDYYKDLCFLKRKDQMEEFMFLGLRLTKGISVSEFKKRFGVDIESVYKKVIDKYTEQNMLLYDNDSICLTDAGIDVSNRIMAEFML